MMTEIAAKSKNVEPLEDDEDFWGQRAKKVLQIHDARVRAKANVSRATTKRLEAFEVAIKHLPAIERARHELEVEFEAKGYLKTVGANAIANRLNEYHRQAVAQDKKDRTFKPPRGETWGRSQVGETLARAPDHLIECAVLECRTKMTALAMSADFTKPLEAVCELEREYLGYIAEALQIKHRLNGNRTRDESELLIEARHEAINVAERQRGSQDISMFARQGLWQHFAAPVRRVFEVHGISPRHIQHGRSNAERNSRGRGRN